MRSRIFRHSFALIGTALLCTSCQIKVPNIKMCSVQGALSQGAFCANTNHDETEELSLDQTIDMLEPQAERRLPNGTVMPGRAGGVIIPSEDARKLKTFIQQACRKLGSGVCTPEVNRQIEEAVGRIDKAWR